MDEIRALLARHLTDYQVRSVAEMGEGSDNAHLHRLQRQL